MRLRHTTIIPIWKGAMFLHFANQIVSALPWGANLHTSWEEYFMTHQSSQIPRPLSNLSSCFWNISEYFWNISCLVQKYKSPPSILSPLPCSFNPLSSYPSYASLSVPHEPPFPFNHFSAKTLRSPPDTLKTPKLRDNNGRKKTLVTQSCVLSDAWFK